MHSWTFSSYFQPLGFGWRAARKAAQHVRTATKEIQTVARTDRHTAAEGVVLFLELLWPAVMQVNDSGAVLARAIHHFEHDLGPLLLKEMARDPTQRADWLDRLLAAIEVDEREHLQPWARAFGALCGDDAKAWGLRLKPAARRAWGAHAHRAGAATACLSCLLHADLDAPLLAMLAMSDVKLWRHRRFGATATRRDAGPDAALAYAEASERTPDDAEDFARFCEASLLELGRRDEAYTRFALAAQHAQTRWLTFQHLQRTYPERPPAEMLEDCVRQSPGSEGKWFAAARQLGLLDRALALAKTSPTDPKVLLKASKDLGDTDPDFAVEAALIALHWLAEGRAYKTTDAQVKAAVKQAQEAATRPDLAEHVVSRLSSLAAHAPHATVRRCLRLISVKD